MARINDFGLAKLRERLTPLALRGAEQAAEVLREKLSGEGSGRKYASLPNRSSSEHEYAAEQSGRLKASVGAKKTECGASFGLIDNVPSYAAALHFKPPSDGGRPVIDDALHDRDIHQAFVDAIGGKRLS